MPTIVQFWVVCSYLIVDHCFERSLVLRAGQHFRVNHEHRHAGDAGLLIGMP